MILRALGGGLGFQFVVQELVFEEADVLLRYHV
jgi:hypothetical protein